jgi:protein SCO1/2
MTMKMVHVKTLCFLMALLVIGEVCSAQRLFGVEPDYANTSANAPDAVTKAGFDQKLNAQLPLDLVFKNEAGEDVKLGDYFGDKPVLLNLVYFNCPMLCTVILNGLTETMKDIKFTPGSEYEVVTVSFNHRETPELASSKKASYLELLGRPEAAAGWHFLTGSEANIRKLADTVGFKFSWDAEREEYAHASGIMIATPDGRLSHYFYGVMYEPRDVRLSLVEASSGKIGSAVDQLLLFCYHYDAATGKYSGAIMTMIQIGAVLTIASMGGYMFYSLRREFNDRRQAQMAT